VRVWGVKQVIAPIRYTQPVYACVCVKYGVCVCTVRQAGRMEIARIGTYIQIFIYIHVHVHAFIGIGIRTFSNVTCTGAVSF